MKVMELRLDPVILIAIVQDNHSDIAHKSSLIHVHYTLKEGAATVSCMHEPLLANKYVPGSDQTLAPPIVKNTRPLQGKEQFLQPDHFW